MGSIDGDPFARLLAISPVSCQGPHVPPALSHSCSHTRVLFNKVESSVFLPNLVCLCVMVGALCAFKNFDLIRFSFMKKLELYL